MTVKENGLGIGFSDQWSLYGDKRYSVLNKHDPGATRSLFMSSLGFGFGFGG
jgi:hypothetical protein